MDLFNKFSFKEYADVYVLYLHGPDRSVISTRMVSLRSFTDMKGLVLRASGGATTMMSALGATPRAMHMGEAYTALTKGVVEWIRFLSALPDPQIPLGGASPTVVNWGSNVSESMIARSMAPSSARMP
jgi:hypothetical protein